jgi:DNA-binding transcriptional LysR family regulator
MVKSLFYLTERGICLSLRLNDLRRMAIFAIVAREGSFSAAARYLQVAVSVVSGAVAQLERDWGVQLLARNTRRLALTGDGVVAEQRCAQMLRAAQAAHDGLGRARAELEGVLTITASECDIDWLILPALSPLLRAHRKLRLNLIVSDQQLDMLAGQIDLAVRVGALRDASIVARALMRYPEALVAAPGYLRRCGVPAGIEDLAELQMIGLTAFNEPLHLRLLDAKGQSQRVQFASAAQTDSVGAAKSLCLAQLGVARLPAHFVAQELRSGTLATVLPAYRLPEIRLYMVTQRRDLLPRRISAALQALRAYATTQLAGAAK